MKCPSCNVDLVMSERSGIEIDYCPQCRGVWLDRGELDKIIERSSQATPPPPPQQPQQPPRDSSFSTPSRGDLERHLRDEDRRRDDDYKRYRDDDDYYKRKKKKGFLDDLFDF